jgi:hypothetical protein
MIKDAITIIILASLLLTISACENSKPANMAQSASYSKGTKKLRFYDPSTGSDIFILVVSDNTEVQITNVPKSTPTKNSRGVFVNRTYWEGFWYDGKLIKINKGSTYKYPTTQTNSTPPTE